VFAVKQTNVALLESTLLQVSDPGHQGYGKHLSLQAVNEMVRPSVASASAISSFLHDSGVDIDDTCQSNGNGDLIKCVLSVMQVEAMLEAKYINFEHKSGVSVLRTLKYSLPASVASHVDFVAPTVHLPPVRTIPARTELSEARNNTPSALRALYGLGSVRGRAPANSQVRLRAVETGKLTRSADLLGAQAVTGFLQQHFLESDLHRVTQQLLPSTTHACAPRTMPSLFSHKCK
jgi:tripeptidyl-peptidase-1